MSSFLKIILPKVNRNNFLYIFGYSLTLIFALLEITNWNISDGVLSILKATAFLFLGIIFAISLPRYKTYSIWILVCFISIIYIAFKTDIQFQLIAFVALLFGAKNQNFNNILKTYFIVSVCFFTITVLGSMLGLVENYAIDNNMSGERFTLSSTNVRYAYGYNWPTGMGAHCSFILLAYWYLKRMYLSKIEILIFGGVIFWLNVYMDVRQASITILLCLVSSLIFNQIKKKSIYYPFIFSIPLLFMLAVWATVTFNFSNPVWWTFNSFFLVRLSLGNYAINHNGIPFWGQYLRLYGGETSGEYYNYIDSSYIQLIVIYGVVFTIYILSAYWALSYKAYKQKDYPLVLTVFIIGIAGLIIPCLNRIAFNPFIFALFANHSNQSPLFATAKTSVKLHNI